MAEMTLTVAAAGLTKRELFAMFAMQSLTKPMMNSNHHQPDVVAAWAVLYADALIAELNKPAPEKESP